MTRAGFVALAGRPNAGKSTLLNQIVGAKVAITSPRPQTTRRAIRGVSTGPDWQLVVVDLPGVQKPRDPLTERMQRCSWSTATRRSAPAIGSSPRRSRAPGCRR
jgi:GTPase